MRVLMFGRGVVATVYGWALEQAGHEVEFYVRPGRAAAYGPVVELDLLDTRRRVWGQRTTAQWPVRYRETLEDDHDVDLIVLSVAHHRLRQAVDFLDHRRGGATVLVFGNVWDEPQAVAEALGVERVAWGFPRAGGGFGADGVLRATLGPTIVVGTQRQPTAGDQVARQVFQRAGFGLHEQEDFRGWLWIHFVTDAGLHAQGLQRGSLAGLVGDGAALREAMLTGRELLALVAARGVDLRAHRGSTLLLCAPSWLTATALARATRHFPPARTTFEAHDDTGAEEPRAICRDALEEARRLGVQVPRLEAAAPAFASGPQAPPGRATGPGRAAAGRRGAGRRCG